MMLLCLLCACSGKENNPLQAPMDFRSDLLRQGGCRLLMEGTADVEDRVWSFALDCCLGTDGSMEAEILRPEDLSGITAQISGETGKLTCEDVSVEFGASADERLSPLSAPRTLMQAWTDGYISSAGPEDGLTLAVFELGYDSDTITVHTWFDETGVPVRAELAHRGTVGVRLMLSNFELSSGGNYEAAEENLGGCVPGQSGP